MALYCLVSLWFQHLSSSFILPSYQYTMISVSFHLFVKYLLWSEKGTISIRLYSQQGKTLDKWSLNSVKLLSYADQSKCTHNQMTEDFPLLLYRSHKLVLLAKSMLNRHWWLAFCECDKTMSRGHNKNTQWSSVWVHRVMAIPTPHVHMLLLTWLS